MARFGHLDILMELVELCHEVADDIKQQLGYYRASVYKNETATIIRDKIVQLQNIAKLINDDHVIDCFLDFQAVQANGNVALIPGECSFSSRIGQLIANVEANLRTVAERASQKHGQTNPSELAKNVQQHRRELLGLCRHGSRQWDFFQTF